jgi:hypothetical protein
MKTQSILFDNLLLPKPQQVYIDLWIKNNRQILAIAKIEVAKAYFHNRKR